MVGEEATGGAPDPVHLGMQLLTGVRHDIDWDPIEPLNKKWKIHTIVSKIGRQGPQSGNFDFKIDFH